MKIHTDVLVNKVGYYGLNYILELFTRDALRKLAKEYDIPRGRLKRDTIQNLRDNRYKWKHKIFEITLV